jgi:large subunit ribosomal protein L4
MELNVINEQGQESAKLQASDVLFGRDSTKLWFTRSSSPIRRMHVPAIASRRIAPKSVIPRPNRGVKGTGRARAGNGSPLWRGGGRIFPNSPEENFSQKVNKKMFRAGMAAILSELARQGRMVVIDDLTIEAPKTKLFSQKLKSLGLEGNLLVITDTLNENLYLSSRNLPNVLVLEAQEADPVSLVRFAKVLVTKNAVAKFEEMWG